MPHDAVMFDLDGTLADTLRDIAEAGNHMLRRLDRRPIELPRYRYLAGQGLRRLVEDALETDDPELIDRGVSHFRAYYADHKYDHTQPYEGVADLLDELTNRGLTLAVMSNKPDDATRAMVEHVFGRWTFKAVRGHRDDMPLKPDPAAVLAIAEELGVPAPRWIYVGDTLVDMQTGVAAGMLTVGVTWGFRDEDELRQHGAQRIINHPSELLELL